MRPIPIPDIDSFNLASLDLNLLTAFEVLMAERNVTSAADRIGITQSSMSHTLARLRGLLGDPVLIRRGGGMVPTQRALELIGPVMTALHGIRRALRPPDAFVPERSRHHFRMLTADFVELLLLPPLLRRLGRQAPGIELEVTHLGSGFPAEELRSGRIDIALGTFFVPDGFVERQLLAEDFLCIVRKRHPTVRRRLTLRRYTELGHLLVSPFGGYGGVVDRALVPIRKRRHVAIQTRHFLIAPFLIAQSDLVATIPRRLAERLAKLLPLQTVPPPIRLGPFSINMVWHERTAEQPPHQWLRQLLTEVATTI